MNEHPFFTPGTTPQAQPEPEQPKTVEGALAAIRSATDALDSAITAEREERELDEADVLDFLRDNASVVYDALSELRYYHGRDYVPDAYWEEYANDLLRNQDFDLDEIIEAYGSEDIVERLEQRGELNDHDHDEAVSQIREAASRLEDIGYTELSGVENVARDIASDLRQLADELEG